MAGEPGLSLLFIFHSCCLMSHGTPFPSDAVPDGQTPHTVSLCAYDELVDLVKPGDRVTITGIFRSIPVRQNPRQRSIKALFKTYIDVVHVKRTNVARMGYDPTTRGGEGRPPGVGVGGEDDEEEGLSSADRMGMADGDAGMNIDGEPIRAPSANAEIEQKLIELSKRPDIYNMLSRSMAPSIWEMEDVKKGILLQLFGGTNKSIARGGGGGGPRYRGDINILMVGDPGTSKSQILNVSLPIGCQWARPHQSPYADIFPITTQYVHKIAPRGVYTSGKGSSAVGLTAYITRDPDSKQLVLESGALVLSDGGVCCIDEFDKMSDATRSVLHEVMVRGSCLCIWRLRAEPLRTCRNNKPSPLPRLVSSPPSTRVPPFSPLPTQSTPSITQSYPSRPTSISHRHSSQGSTCSTSSWTRSTRPQIEGWRSTLSVCTSRTNLRAEVKIYW